MRRSAWPSVVAVTALLLGVAVFADGPPAPLMTLPYHGFLQNNGVPVDDVLDVSFALYDAESNGSELWSDVVAVDPDSGAFGVVLGAQTPLPATVRTANAVFLEVAIDGTVLGGRERLHPAFQAVTANGAVEANYALGNRSGTFRMQKDGTTSTIAFDAQTNDPGQIVHVENNNTADLWIDVSDDFNGNNGTDEFIVGDYPSTKLFQVNGIGDAWLRRHLDVDGNVEAANMFASTVDATTVTADGVVGTNVAANGYVRANQHFMRGFETTLTGTNWVTIPGTAHRGAGFMFVQGTANDSPASVFWFLDDSNHDVGHVERMGYALGYNTNNSIVADWPSNSGIRIRKSQGTYDGTYRVGFLALQ